MTITIGQRALGNRRQLDAQSLTTSSDGVYEIEMKIQGSIDQQSTVDALSQLSMYVPEASVQYIQVDEDTALMQVSGKSFAWVDVFQFLPSILGFIGVTLILFTVYELIRSIPSGLIAVLIIGGFMAIVLPNIVTVPWGAQPKRSSEKKEGS